MQKNSVLRFWAAIVNLLTNLIYYIFFFLLSYIIRISNLLNTNFLGLEILDKAQKIVKLSFLAFLTSFLKICSKSLWHFEDVPIKWQNKFLYYKVHM